MRNLQWLGAAALLSTLLTAVAQPERKIQFTPETQLAFSRDNARTTVKTLENGSQVVEFNGSRQLVTVARIGPDGKVETFCTAHEKLAKAFLAGEPVEKLSERPQ